MCKNFFMSNTNKLTEKEFIKLRRLCAKVLTNGADTDGFGYAAINSDTLAVFGERFLNVKAINFQLTPNNPTPINQEGCIAQEVMPDDVPTELADMFLPDKIAPVSPSNFFGTYGKPVGAFLAHARYSTNQVSLTNTHPHRTEKYTLIHNGVVRNVGAYVTRVSTCDTEYLVRHLTNEGVKGMVKSVIGNYAIGAICHDTLDFLLVKDDKTDLFGAWVSRLDAMVVGTDEDQLIEICEGMKWKYSETRFMQDCIMRLFDVNGTLIEKDTIKPTKALGSDTPLPISKKSWDKKEEEDKWAKRDLEHYARYYEVKHMTSKRVISFQQFLAMPEHDQWDFEVYEKETGRLVSGGGY